MESDDSDEREPLLLGRGVNIQLPDSETSDRHYRSTKLIANAQQNIQGRDLRRRTRGGVTTVLEQEEQDPYEARRSFCRSWCEIWFYIARSRVSCALCTAILWVFGILLILLTLFSGMEKCPTLNGAAIFCYIMGSLSLSLGLLCCCYHWIRSDEDLPHALFCLAYCLLLLFIFTSVAGTTSVLTNYETLNNGSYYPPEGHNHTECGDLTHLPVGVMFISFVLGGFFVVMSYVACVLALGATSDIKW